MDPKKVGLRKEQAKFEKENVEELDGGGVKEEERQLEGIVVLIEKLLFGNLAFFLLPSKTEWALVYCPEALSLYSAGSYTDCTNELEL